MNNSESLKSIVNHQKLKEQVVFTNGCFDLLHVGHLRYLKLAKDLGDILVIGLNSDSSVKRLKGDARPIIPESNRREMLLGLKSVDYVLLFDEDTPIRLIEEVSPDFLVKGGDWPVESIVGHELVLAKGGKVLSLPFSDGHSSTNVIEKIKSI